MNTQHTNTIRRAEEIKARITSWLGADKEGLNILDIARYEDLVAAEEIIECELDHAIEAARIEREMENLKLASIQLAIVSSSKSSAHLLAEKERSIRDLQKLTNTHLDVRRLKLHLRRIVNTWKFRSRLMESHLSKPFDDKSDP